MFQEFFARSELLFLPLIAMGIFFVTFILVVAHVAVGMKKSELTSHIATLPLDDEGEMRYRAEGEGLSS
jgi:hypothetical protein